MTFNRILFILLLLFTFSAPAEEPTPEQEALTEVRNIVEVLNRMKFSGYLQAQYVNNEASTPARNFDEFSVRRARVKFTYQVTPTSRFVLQPDVTSSGVTLKDGFIEFTEPWTPWKHTLTAGQFNWPFGFEIMYSSSAREMPERPRVIRTLFPGERDRGLMLSGRGLNERFLYQVAIVNGSGTTQSSDANERKDFVGRHGDHERPPRRGLHAGQSREGHPDDGRGSGVGLAALINGTTDIAASSRPIRTSEKEKIKQRFAAPTSTSRTTSSAGRTSRRARRRCREPPRW